MPNLAPDPLRELAPATRDQIYSELREQMPVYRSSVLAAWVLTRYEDVTKILRHPDALALEMASFLRSVSQRGKLDLSSLIQFCSSVSLLTRPPRHEAVRRVLTQSLARIWRMNLPELLGQRADLLLDSGERDGSIDLACSYGGPLARFVIGTFLGVPEEDLPEISALARDLIVVLERTYSSVSTLIKLNRSAAALIDYFVRLIALRRQNSGDDGTSLMVKLADEQLGCSDEELAGFCTFFFIAAEETTAASISGAALLLLQNPPLRARLLGDPSRLPHAVGEMLRLMSPVQFVARKLGVDVSLKGHLVGAGDPIVLMLGAANRDPAAFSNPDEIDLDRNGPESLVFVMGPYRCIGAQLAIFEIESAISKLLKRPNLRLSSESPVWSDRMNIAPLLQLQACFV